MPKRGRQIRDSGRDPRDPHTSWKFTLNNYTDADITMVKNWATQCTRLVCAKEVGAEGTAHLQGGMTLRRAKRFPAMKTLCERMHWEIAILAEEDLYCMKEGSEVFVNVDNGQQGKRTDLDDVAEALKTESVVEVARRFPTTYMKFHAGINALGAALAEQDLPVYEERRWPLMWTAEHECILWGPEGTGKTVFALQHFKKPLLVTDLEDLKHLTKSHDGIVFDDMDFTTVSRSMLIKLVGRDLPRSIRVTYGKVTIPRGMPRIFTTNERRGACMDWDQDGVRRRVHVYSTEDLDREVKAAKLEAAAAHMLGAVASEDSL